MPSWRKKLFWCIVLALVVCVIVFWGTLVGGCCLIALIQGFQFYLFGDFASRDLAKTFDENGKNVEGWKGGH